MSERNKVCAIETVVTPNEQAKIIMPWRWFSTRTVVDGMATAKFGLFRGLIAPKQYVPHQNSGTKGISLGWRLAPEMIPIAQNCAV